MTDETFIFLWDEYNVAHIARHQVTPEEAEAVFFDPRRVEFADLRHSTTEARAIVIGQTETGRLLYQVSTVRERHIRVISSRDLNRKETHLYEESIDRSDV